MRKPVLATLLAVLCLACAMLPVAPKTPREALLAAEYEMTAALQTAVDLADAGTITSPRAQQLDRAFGRARRALDTAWRVVIIEEGEPDLVTVHQALLSLRALLETEQ